MLQDDPFLFPLPQPGQDRFCRKEHHPRTTPLLSFIQGSSLPLLSFAFHLRCSEGLFQPLGQAWLRLKTVLFCFKGLTQNLVESPHWCGKVCVLGGAQSLILNLSLHWAHGSCPELWHLGEETVEVRRESRRLQYMGFNSLFYLPTRTPTQHRI